MGLVWSFMGYSPGYNYFTGGAEVLGAVLLCFRRTTTLGALVVVGVMSNVAALNYFYDVPVKLYSSQYGDTAPRPPLYGIYAVTAFNWDGQELPPLTTDLNRWRSIIFGPYRGARVRMMDDSQRLYRAMVRPDEQGLTLTRLDGAEAPLLLSYEQPEANSLVLQGTAGERTLHVLLKKVDESRYPLLNRGFHWINEYPFNR